jgi:hypothetical protein
LQRVAAKVGISEEVLTRAFSRRAKRPAQRQERSRPAQVVEAPRVQASRDPGEDFLAALLLRYPEVDSDLAPDLDIIESPELRRLLQDFRADRDLDRLLADPEAGAEAEYLHSIRLPPFAVEDARAAVLDAVDRLQRRRLRQAKSLETVQIAHLEEQVGARELVAALLTEDAQPDRRLEDQEDELRRVRGTLRTSRALHLSEADSPAAEWRRAEAHPQETHPLP